MKTFYKYLIIIVAWLAVLYPLYERAKTVSWPADITTSYLAVFPFLGLAAVSMLWLHAVSGVFEPRLRQHINFDRFVDVTAKLILICFALHPFLLLAGLGFSLSNVFLYYGTLCIWLGIVSWLLLIVYDLAKPFKNQGFFSRHWQKVLVISNAGFLLSFFHSLNVGSDLQTGPLRMIWIFYGVTGAAALIYTYAIKPFMPSAQQKTPQ